jgi:hypothetical protein
VTQSSKFYSDNQLNLSISLLIILLNLQTKFHFADM